MVKVLASHLVCAMLSWKIITFHKRGYLVSLYLKPVHKDIKKSIKWKPSPKLDTLASKMAFVEAWCDGCAICFNIGILPGGYISIRVLTNREFLRVKLNSISFYIPMCILEGSFDVTCKTFWVTVVINQAFSFSEAKQLIVLKTIFFPEY